MTKERRYSEQQIAAIFEHAAEAEKSARRKMSGSDGLTLEELQEIGREVGFSPEHIARAAAVVVAVPAQPERTRTTLGLPTHVARTVNLPRNLTDEEWDRLVVELRETFRARGEVRREGSLRQWTNGNLQALLEPGESGHRLRLRTFHENARFGVIGGLLAAAFILVILLIVAVTGRLELDPDGLLLALMGTIGLVLAGFNASRIRRWAAERRSQMEKIVASVSAMVERHSETKAEAPVQDFLDLSPDEPEPEVIAQKRRQTRS